MDLLEALMEKFYREMGKQQHVVVLHINHQMENSFLFNEYLKKLFADVVFFGLPYHKDMQEKSFETVCEEELCRIFKQEILPYLNKGKRILILEDGGYICRVLEKWKRIYPEIESQIIGVVEQTTSGTKRTKNYYKEKTYPFPWVSVARSHIKMDVEALFIGSKLVRELEEFLYELDTFLEFHQVLLLGYGTLGRVIADLLKNRHLLLTVYDKNEEIRKIAKQDGHIVLDKAEQVLFSMDTIVFGVTGEASFTMEMLEKFRQSPAKCLYLASGSSKEIEFSNLKNHIEFDEKKIYLLADGRPLNFYRENGKSLTFCMMDLIFSEMLYCAVWILQEKRAQKMHLLGVTSEIALEEMQLFDEWCKKYHLFYAYPKPHPGKALLQKMSLETE